LVGSSRGVARDDDLVLIGRVLGPAVVLLIVLLAGLGFVIVVDLVVLERGLVAGGVSEADKNDKNQVTYIGSLSSPP
jgi:hypothetical protein